MFEGLFVWLPAYGFLSVGGLAMDCLPALVVGGCLRMVVTPSGVASDIYGEFDPGSGRTLAACLTHASRTMMPSLLGGLVANG